MNVRTALLGAFVALTISLAFTAVYETASWNGSTPSRSSTIQSTSQSAVEYPLVWAPNPLSVCEATAFCIDAKLGFSGQQATNTTSSATTITGSNATTIIYDSTTTIIRSTGTDYVFPSPNTSYPVVARALIQDAVTGQNATTPTPSGTSVIAGTCYIQPTGFSQCLIGAPYEPAVPSGHPYNVTVFVTALDGKTALARPSPTITVPAGTWGTTNNTTSTSATAGSSTASVSSSVCGQPADTILNWAPGGNDYMKVVTDQGNVITNGTLIVTAVGNATNGEWGVTSHLWITLGDINGTGYLSLVGGGFYLESGYYNVTLVAGYNNQEPCYTAAIPPIQVHPNSTVYVTVSVPSGLVTVVTSAEGGSSVTTTTTATTTKNGG